MFVSPLLTSDSMDQISSKVQRQTKLIIIGHGTQ